MKIKTLTKIAAGVLSTLALLQPLDTLALPQLAFPEADGYGRYTIGGRGGKVYVVTSLEDNPDKPKEGSLRYALEQKEARTITFAVSGVINLHAPLKIKNGFVTLAGQSSPQGITIAGQPFTIGASQVIVRYLRFRLGSQGPADDAANGTRNSDIIFDHCSFSWSIDETASFYQNINFTLQYSIISQSLKHASHPKGDHGYGGIWGGAGASFHHNVIAHHDSRTPRLNGYRLGSNYAKRYEFTDLRNNVVYNWGHNSAYGAEDSDFNFINNYFIAGPASNANRLFQFIAERPEEAFGRGYFAGNIYENKDGTLAKTPPIKVKGQKRDVRVADPQRLLKSPLKSERTPFFVGTKGYRANHSAKQIYDILVIKQEVGANRAASGYFLDAVDKQVLEDIATRTTKYGSNGLIDSELEVIGSWDKYAAQFSQATKATMENLQDKDSDGMPDNWEKGKKVTDPNGNDLDKVYTNLEVYLNEIGHF